MVPVMIVGLQLNPAAASVVVLAESPDAARALPILIGSAEAQAIAVAVAGVEPTRPATHDLLLALLRDARYRLEEIAVTELVDGTFHAELFVESPDGLRRVSARPSDAIALAVRVDASMCVHQRVLDEAAVPIRHVGPDLLSDDEIEEVVTEFHQFLANTGPEDFVDPPPELD